MTTYVALLRGVNVSGRNPVAMADLRKLFIDLGCTDVRTYVQSGNVIFNRTGPSSELERTIEEKTRSVLAISVTVLVRTPRQLATVRDGNPFVVSGRELAKLHVTFLAQTPSAGRVRQLQARDFAPEELHVARREVYLHCPNGYGKTKLNNAFLEKQLGVTATTRSWKTVSKLSELATA